MCACAGLSMRRRPPPPICCLADSACPGPYITPAASSPTSYSAEPVRMRNIRQPPRAIHVSLNGGTGWWRAGSPCLHAAAALYSRPSLPRAHNSAPAICPAANSTPATPRHTQRPHQLIWDNYKWAMDTQKMLAILFLSIESVKSSIIILQKGKEI